MGATAAISGIAQGASQVGGAWAQSQAIRAQSRYQSRMFDLNARYAELQATDAEQRGGLAAARHLAATRRLVGSQRAPLAAQCVDVGSGSAADVQAASEAMGELDALTIRNNAMREAFGYRAQALGMRSQAHMGTLAARGAAFGTLLSGGLAGLRNATSPFARQQDYVGDYGDRGFMSDYGW